MVCINHILGRLVDFITSQKKLDGKLVPLKQTILVDILLLISKLLLIKDQGLAMGFWSKSVRHSDIAMDQPRGILYVKCEEHTLPSLCSFFVQHAPSLAPTGHWELASGILHSSWGSWRLCWTRRDSNLYSRCAIIKLHLWLELSITSMTFHIMYNNELNKEWWCRSSLCCGMGP